MKGYFACPLASGRNRKTALELVRYIESHGHEILDRHVVAEEGKTTKVFSQNSGIPLEEVNSSTVRKQDLQWVQDAEFMVLDYTNGSWGGGIEFHHATMVRKLLGLEPIPILCLLEKGSRGSWLIQGINRTEFPNVWLREYYYSAQATVMILLFFKHFGLA